VISQDELDRKYARNLSFALRLVRYRKAISARAPATAITQDYAVMWWLSVTRAFDFRIFYYPGLGNQFAIGRKPRLGKLLSGIYDTVQLSRLRKMSLVLAAASKDDIAAFTQRWSRRLRGLRIHQLPTAVDIDFFSPQGVIETLRSNYGLATDRVNLICVGRLAKVKGIDFLIDALAIFNDTYQPARLLVLGDGEESESLRQYAAKNGLADAVDFRGNVPPHEVRDLVNCADVCVVGSHFEGFSCAMVEQLACGKPLVSTNVSGAAEIIEQGKNGYVVDRRDPAAFAKCVDAALRLTSARETSRKIATDRYSEQAVWSALLSLLERDGVAL
jgi:glycosyltransferase involved in cell wall biosynthesis